MHSRVALICPEYPPEIVPAATMLAQLAQHLVGSGFGVTVFTTFPSLPQGEVFEGYRRHIWECSQHDSVRVVRCFSFMMGRGRRPFWRILSHVSFGITAALRLLLDRRYDVIVMEVFPILTSPIILTASKYKGSHVINYIQDIYPEAAEAANIIPRGGIAARFARAVDRLVCRKCELNLVIAESFRQELTSSRDVPESKTEVVQNWIDGTSVRPVRRDGRWRAENRIPKSNFVAMFAGTMGLASGVGILINVAEELRGRGCSEIMIVCIGEGLLKDVMMRQASEKHLENIMFLPFQPQERLSEVQSAADVMLLTMEENHEKSSCPSKLITYMAAGRPVLCCTSEDSEVAKTIRCAGCGKVVPQTDISQIADRLIEMASDMPPLVTMGASGREFFLRTCDISVAMSRFDKIFARFSNEGCARKAGVESL